MAKMANLAKICQRVWQKQRSWPKGPHGKRRIWRKWRIWRKFAKGLDKSKWVGSKGPVESGDVAKAANLAKICQRLWRKRVRKTNELVTHSTCLLSRKCHWKGAMFSTCTSSLKFTFCIHLIQKRLLWALAMGHWETIVWRSLKRSISLFSYAQMPKAQLPMTNCQSNFDWIRYIYLT